MTTRVKYLLIMVLALSILTTGYTMKNMNHSGTCDSPCTVVFPDGTEEDEFRIDYSNGSLLVWRATKANMESR